MYIWRHKETAENVINFLSCPSQDVQPPPTYANMIVQFVSTFVTYATSHCLYTAFKRAEAYVSRSTPVLTQLPAKSTEDLSLST